MLLCELNQRLSAENAEAAAAAAKGLQRPGRARAPAGAAAAAAGAPGDGNDAPLHVRPHATAGARWAVELSRARPRVRRAGSALRAPAAAVTTAHAALLASQRFVPFNTTAVD